MLKRLWCEDEGVLTFEWIMLVTILVIGVVGGLSAVRDAMNHEMYGVTGAMVSLDHAYSISQPIGVAVSSGDGSTSCDAGGVESFNYDVSQYETDPYAYGEYRREGLKNQVDDSNLSNNFGGCNPY